MHIWRIMCLHARRAQMNPALEAIAALEVRLAQLRTLQALHEGFAVICIRRPTSNELETTESTLFYPVETELRKRS